MLLPMPPTSSMFLLAESREHPMHVGSLQLYQPPEGSDALDIRARFDQALLDDEVAPLFQKRARRSVTTLGQWAWETDVGFDLQHHVRRNALPRPGRILELLALCSRLHSTLLDRNRPLWEMHLIEGLEDGRYAVYFKVHHALVDGVAALRLLNRMMSPDPNDLDMPAPWAPRERTPRDSSRSAVDLPTKVARDTITLLGHAAGIGPTLANTIGRAVKKEGSALSLSAPKSMLNVKITGARRFAAQSWPVERLRAIAKASDTTLNDVVLAMSSGALRQYLISMNALPDTSLIAMVPVSLRGDEDGRGDGGGNAVGAVMCTLGTDLDDAAERLATVHRSMEQGKDSMRSRSQLEIMAASALGVAPLAMWVLGLVDNVRPPFNVIISNVPGPRRPLYWNGARLDGLYPLSIPVNGQALNITCTSYSEEIAFGLIGCRRTVPHLQRMLTYLDDELGALEQAVGV